jgi:hypothetical protein
MTIQVQYMLNEDTASGPLLQLVKGNAHWHRVALRAENKDPKDRLRAEKQWRCRIQYIDGISHSIFARRRYRGWPFMFVFRMHGF